MMGILGYLFRIEFLIGTKHDMKLMKEKDKLVWRTYIKRIKETQQRDE